MARLIFIICFIPLLFHTPVAARDTTAPRLASWVKTISAAKTNEARREAIAGILKKMGIDYELQNFVIEARNNKSFTGVNIQTGSLSSDKPLLLIGAHYDKVKKGHGAIDNASGVAAVLAILAAQKTKPLKNLNLAAVLFDLEEVGLLGSRAWVRDHAGQLPRYFINFDVFGYGDTIWVMSKDKSKSSGQAVVHAAEKHKVPLSIGPLQPPTDYIPFLRADVESLSFSLIGGEEIDPLLKMLKEQKMPDPMPRVFQVIHSDGDVFSEYDAVAVAKAVKVVSSAIEQLDQP